MTTLLLQTTTGLIATATVPAAIWFPTPPGVTSLPAAPAVTVNPTPYPPNSVATPAGFDPGNLQALFGSILPYGTAAVWPREMNAAHVIPPYNEVVPLLAETRTACDVLDFPYAFTVPGTTAALTTTTACVVTSLLLVGMESKTLQTTTALEVSSLFQIGIEQLTLQTTTACGMTDRASGLLFTETSCEVVVSPSTVYEVRTSLAVAVVPPTVLQTTTGVTVTALTYFNDWSWQNYEWDADLWPEGWAN